MEITVKKIKTFRGHDGQGYNCDLYVDGVLAAYCTEMADGGEMQIDYVSREMRDKVENWAKAQPRVEEKDKSIWPDGYSDFCLFVFIDKLVGDAEHEKRVKAQYKRWLKTQVCFQVPGDKEGEFRSMQHNGQVELVKKEVLRRYPTAKFLQPDGKVA
jgi:hypothetical protein